MRKPDIAYFTVNKKRDARLNWLWTMGGKILHPKPKKFYGWKPNQIFMNTINQFVLIYLAKIQLFLEIFKQFFKHDLAQCYTRLFPIKSFAGNSQ